MSQEDLARAHFLELLHRPKEERQAEAERLCGGDSALLARVLALLRVLRQSDLDDEPTMTPPVASLDEPLLVDHHAPPTVSPPIPVGETVGRYRLEGILGRGGMGFVYLARNDQSGYQCALKMIRNDNLLTETMIKRFLQEMYLLGKVNDPRVARLLHADLHKGIPYYVMEFVPGESFQATVDRQGARPADQAVRWIIEAAGALQSLHGHGIVHRDIKPSNLMITDRDQVNILDLGIARSLEPVGDTPGITEAGGFLGTRAYIAPEQSRAPSAADARSDIFSLGLVLQFLVTGKAPMRQSGFPPTIPKGLDAIVAKMTEEEPSQRYSTGSDVAKALKDWLDGPGSSTPVEVASREYWTIGHVLISIILLFVAVVAARWLPRRTGLLSLGGLMNLPWIDAEQLDPRVRTILNLCAIIYGLIAVIGVIYAKRKAIAWLLKWILGMTSVGVVLIVLAWSLAPGVKVDWDWPPPIPIPNRPPWRAALEAADAHLSSIRDTPVSQVRFALAVPLPDLRGDEILESLRLGLGVPEGSDGWTLLGPEGTTWRVAAIDLSGLGWSTGRWERLVRDDPYALSFGNDPALKLIEDRLEAAMGGTGRPLIRADWLLARKLDALAGTTGKGVRVAYDQDLTVDSTAGELGVSTEALREAAESDPIQGFASLRDLIRDGAIPRERWAGKDGSLFQRVAGKLLRAIPIR